MKKSTHFLPALSIVTILVCGAYYGTAQNIFPSTGRAGIGTITPNATSVLDMVSTTQGVLVPRMTKTQRDAIVTPATGLMIFQTNNTPGFYYYSGAVWTAVTPKSKGWALTGNSGTNSSINFIGTNDTAILVFRVNNLKSGLLDLRYNSAFGINALYNNQTGSHNVAIGNAALKKYVQSYNTAVGDSALANNTNGLNGNAAFNTALGYAALTSNTIGYSNTASGSAALYSNTTGYYNTANGWKALYSNTTGHDNTASGTNALSNNTTGSYNTASGGFALFPNTTGSFNTANGYAALSNNSTGYNNTANGDDALYANNTGFNNTATGYLSLFFNTSGSDNTATGVNALYSNTTGSYNTANGYYALYNNTGFDNTANGFDALSDNTTGSSNTAVGSRALFKNTTGVYNTANGINTLNLNTTGYYNTASGANALQNNITGNYNTANGYYALFNSTGSGNTGLGYYAAEYPGVNASNSTAIGYYSLVTGSNQVRIGNGSVTSIGGFANWTTFSDGRFKKNIKPDVKGLEFINKLKPVTYTLDISGINNFLRKDMTAIKTPDGKSIALPKEDENAITAKEKIIYSGFIAQDVEKAAKELNYDFSGVDAAKNDKDLYGLRYAEFVVPLVKAVQELSSLNDSLKETVADQQSAIGNQQKINVGLQKQIDDLKALIFSHDPQAEINNHQITISSSLGAGAASLEQNIPNPFTHATSIGYTLPQKFTAAQIMITDKNGKTLKLVIISGTGKGKLNVDASTLASGAYNYSLLIDGKLISTKQMILAK